MPGAQCTRKPVARRMGGAQRYPSRHHASLGWRAAFRMTARILQSGYRDVQQADGFARAQPILQAGKVILKTVK
jgi:hypothetical protein